jgi:hypothetical protein
MTLTHTESVGGKRMVRLARDWTGGDIAAAALIRRADVVVKHVSPAFTDTASFRVVGRDFEFPQDMLLTLDGFGTLHLAGMGGFVLARPRETLRRWPAGTAKVVVGEGRGIFRPLTITDSSDTVTVAAPFMGAAQKEALALIERLTA